MYYVYVLECSDDTLYTGITTDVKRRLQEHQHGIGARYTRGRTPVRLLHTERYRTRSKATKREVEIKKLPKQEKLALIQTGG